MIKQVKIKILKQQLNRQKLIVKKIYLGRATSH